ncbi:hypothetical protein ACFOTA_19930 [Chitinophaga sp. GCM10012297]|uniref:GLPGLI family protein n=1 Tax=Chitinophaga chungangae TaxID=2821488 RepID=A0ABS3YIK1_9BACT|nr:hypothetical protein [Chitinophaga chungangae]MBO9154492.1 hypothetical protein [Chitinophaga chungangae]
MNLLLLVISIYSGFLSSLPWLPGSDRSQTGIYVISVKARMSPGQPYADFLPDDSVFYHQGFGIEKVMKVQDLIVGDNLSRRNETHGYYFVDFIRHRVADLGMDGPTQSTGKINWSRMEILKMGTQFSFRHYNGEKYTSKDTTISGRNFRLIRYIASGVTPLNGAVVTLYFVPGNKEVSFYYKTDQAFNGNLRMMHTSGPGLRGESLMTISFIPVNKDDKKIRQIIQLQKRAGLL